MAMGMRKNIVTAPTNELASENGESLSHAEAVNELVKGIIATEIYGSHEVLASISGSNSSHGFGLAPAFKSMPPSSLSKYSPLVEECLPFQQEFPHSIDLSSLFKNCPIPQSDWTDWVDRVETQYGALWKEVGIYDAIILSKDRIMMDREAVFSLLCFWSRSTNAFHLRCGMIGPTVQDICFLTGLRPHGEEINSLLEVSGIQYQYPMKPNTSERITAHGPFLKASKGNGTSISDSEHISFLVYWLNRFLFCVSSITVTKEFTRLAFALHSGKKLAFAPFVLSYLYRGIGEYINSNFRTCFGPFWLLQLWAYAYFPELHSDLDISVDVPVPGYLYARIQPKRKTFKSMFSFFYNLPAYRASNLFLPFSPRPLQPKWLSFPPGQAPPAYQCEHKEAWASFLIARDLFYGCSTLGHQNSKCGVEYYNPPQFARQFGLTQLVPLPPFRSLNNSFLDREILTSDKVAKKISARFASFFKRFSLQPFVENPSTSPSFDHWWGHYIAKVMAEDWKLVVDRISSHLFKDSGDLVRSKPSRGISVTNRDSPSKKKRSKSSKEAAAFHDPLGASDYEVDGSNTEDEMPLKRPKVSKAKQGKKPISSARSVAPCLSLVDEEGEDEELDASIPPTLSSETHHSASRKTPSFSAQSSERNDYRIQEDDVHHEDPFTGGIETQPTMTQAFRSTPNHVSFTVAPNSSDRVEVASNLRPRASNSCPVRATIGEKTFGHVTQPSSVNVGSSSQSQPLHQDYTTVEDFDAYFAQVEAGFNSDPLMDEAVPEPTPSSLSPDIERAKQFLVAIVSRDLSELPSLAADVADALSVLVEHHDLDQSQIEQLRSIRTRFPVLVSDFQISTQTAEDLSTRINSKQEEHQSLTDQVRQNISQYRTIRSAHNKAIEKKVEIEREMTRLQQELAETTQTEETLNAQMKEIFQKNVEVEQKKALVSKGIPQLKAEKSKADEQVARSKAADLLGASTPEKSMVVTVGTTDIHPISPQLHHQITIMTGNISGTTTTGERKCGGKRFSFSRRSSHSWGIDPRRILFFFATLSSMGTILLIYFTLSMGKLSGDGDALNWQIVGA